jgi:TetR/AcrR family transcriptional regulator
MVKKLGEDSEKISAIMEAAQKRFAHYGLAKTTMTEIAEDIGMSKASLYYYFPDKEAIFKAVIKHEQDEFLAQIEQMLTKPKKASVYLLEYTKKRNLYFKELINLAQLHSDTHKQVKPLFKGLIVEFDTKANAFITAILKGGIDNQEFKKIDVPYHVEFFNSATSGLRSYLLKRKDAEPLDNNDYDTLEKHTTTLTNLFINGIKK